MNTRPARRDPLAVLQRVIAGGNWVAIDTETTDLGPQAEIIELALIGADGHEYQTLVRPRRKVSREAAQVHHIDPMELDLAPAFSQIGPEVRRWLARRIVLGYHVDFDRQVLWRAFAQVVQPAPRCRWLCLCDLVTRWAGSRRPLDAALDAVGLAHEGPRHRAAADARAVAALARALAMRSW